VSNAVYHSLSTWKNTNLQITFWPLRKDAASRRIIRIISLEIISTDILNPTPISSESSERFQDVEKGHCTRRLEVGYAGAFKFLSNSTTGTCDGGVVRPCL
jgi:hypothetical protein